MFRRATHQVSFRVISSLLDATLPFERQKQKAAPFFKLMVDLFVSHRVAWTVFGALTIKTRGKLLQMRSKSALAVRAKNSKVQVHRHNHNYDDYNLISFNLHLRAAYQSDHFAELFGK